MPFKRHPTFKPAPNSNSKLWRYMSLSKYLSLLHNKSLFFCNLELLAQEDPFEGTLPTSRFEHRSWNCITDVPSNIQDKFKGFLKQGEFDPEIGFHRFKELAELRIRQAYAHRRSYFINCWHLSEHESSAMWDIYSKRQDGIAILSSEAHFEKSFSNAKQDIMGGEIAYGDYLDKDFKIDENNSFTSVLHKRNSFSYENEYRLIHWDTSVTHKQLKAINGFYNWDGKIFQDVTGSGRTTVGRSEDEIEKLEVKVGFNIECNLNELIEKIYISPLAENWFFEAVKDVSSKYGLKAKVLKSELLSEPLR